MPALVFSMIAGLSAPNAHRDSERWTERAAGSDRSFARRRRGFTAESASEVHVIAVGPGGGEVGVADTPR